MTETREQLPGWLGWVRLGIGLAQGLALYQLTELREFMHAEPVYGALWLTLIFVPVLIVGGLGALRMRTLAIWIALATALAFVLGWHELARVEAESRPDYLTPSPVIFAVAALLFVAHHLIQAGDETRKWIAPYERYFDLGWRHGAQLVLAGMFTGAFWIVLHLGASMFEIIGLRFLREWISESWFGLPATFTVFAAAIHLTDLRSGLVRGARALGLVLLSWLLPAMTGLAVAFLVALAFTGLELLWETRAATAILIGAAATLVILVNAAYQDGAAAPNLILRWSARAAAIVMTPLAVLAAYALWLRVDQYGWTPERIYAAAILIVGACYAVSYAIGAVLRQWMKTLEIGNIASAFVVIALGLLLFTPIADPARISVADHMNRYRSGRITAEQVDLGFLRFDGARYGRAALEALRADAALTDRVEQVLAEENRYAWEALRDEPILPLRVRVFPEGATLPEELASQPGTFGALRRCRDTRQECDVLMVDLTGDGAPEAVVFGDYLISAYRQFEGGRWRHIGELEVVADAEQNSRGRRVDELRDALARGEVRVAASQVQDLIVGGQRLRPQATVSVDEVGQ